MFHCISGRAVSVENRLWSHRRVEEFFFLRGNVDLAGGKIEAFVVVAAKFPLQRLASNLLVGGLFKLIGPWCTLMLHG